MAVIVELYTPGDRAEGDARRAASAIAARAPRARHVRSIVMPDDETSFLIFDGDFEHVREAARGAGISSTRVVQGIDSAPPKGRS
jgi:hypothetical protein